MAVEDLLGELSLHGHVLITSRLNRWKGMVRPLELDVLSVDASAAYLLAATDGARKPRSSDAYDSGTLAQLLGQFPIELIQAASYINERGISFKRYMEIWNKSRPKAPPWIDELQVQYPASIVITWETSFQRLSERAKELLCILAWFGTDPIPESLLDAAFLSSAGPARSGVNFLREATLKLRRYFLVTRSAVASGSGTASLREPMLELRRYSLVTRDLDALTFSVDLLVQEVTRQRMSAETTLVSLLRALAWLNAGLQGNPQDVRTWSAIEPLVPHAEAAAEFAEDRSVHDGVGRLLSYCGQVNERRACYSLAEHLYRRELAIDEVSFGPYHPEVAVALNNLAGLLKATSRADEAEPLYRRGLKICEVSLGRDHPNAAVVLNNLAEMLSNKYRLAEAEPMYRRVLAIDEASLEPDHPDIAIGLNNLADLLRTTNRFAEAEPLLRRSLAIGVASFGPNDPIVAIRLNTLAELLSASNRLSEAEPLYRSALAIDEASLGPDHPKVAIRLINLAGLLKALNRLEEAEPLVRRAVEIDEASYGPDHPEVAIDLKNLAELLNETNRLREAENLLRRALVIFVGAPRATGYRHLHLLAVRNRYAGLLRKLGKTEPEVLAALREIAPDPFG